MEPATRERHILPIVAVFGLVVGVLMITGGSARGALTRRSLGRREKRRPQTGRVLVKKGQF
jgi:hypothetical protein